MTLLASSITSPIILIARLCLTYFLLPSALGKIVNRHAFIQGTIEYQVLPKSIAKIFGFILPWVELALSIALITGFMLQITGLIASILFLCFIFAVSVNIKRRRLIKCNCYGIAGTSTISWGTVARNILLLLIATMLTLFSPAEILLDYQWYTNIITVSPSVIIILLFLLIFCILTIHLIEWTIDIYYRISSITLQVGK